MLYFPRSALRTASNPALDVAGALAQALRVPLHVVLCVDAHAPANAPVSRGMPARRFRFWLEGAAEMQAHLQEAAQRAANQAGLPPERASVRASLRVEAPGDRRAVHLTLANRASAVIVDESFQMWPHTRFVCQLATACRAAGVPMALVDTSCVVPAASVPANKTHRAYQYADATKAVRAETLRRAMEQGPQHAWGTEPANISKLSTRENVSSWPMEPSASLSSWRHDLSNLTADERTRWIAERYADAEAILDMNSPAIAHTVGGESKAMGRWREFVQGGGLGRYAGSRNDPNAPCGISGGNGQWKGASRMSAYVNFGMADVMTMAVDATKARSTKYLDEFLTWRELSHAFTFHSCGGDWSSVPSQETVRAAPHDVSFASRHLIPQWARAALAAADREQRASLSSFVSPPLSSAAGGEEVPTIPDELSFGRTGDAFWDACQRHLVATGELHNNLRMTWGKAIVQWALNPPPWATRSASLHSSASERAVAWLGNLNDRFALDGSSPPSYGGLLWTLGLFDSPKGSGVAALRKRPTSWAATRIDLTAFRARAASMEVSEAPVARLFKKARLSGEAAL